jgi:hypothetical protein
MALSKETPVTGYSAKNTPPETGARLSALLVYRIFGNETTWMVFFIGCFQNAPFRLSGRIFYKEDFYEKKILNFQHRGVFWALR